MAWSAAVACTGVASVIGFVVGGGASPWFLLMLPVLVGAFLWANR